MPVKLYHTGEGYAGYYAKEDRSKRVYEHRLLMYAWGEIESPFIQNDLVEIHHKQTPKWLNIESNLQALTPDQHKAIDESRARLITPWDRRAMASD